MKKNRFFSILIACGVLIPVNGSSLPQRLSSEVVDLGKVHPIHMIPGMATMIEIPGPVTGIRLGNPDTLTYFKPEKPDNEVTIVLKQANAQPTNFIIRSGKRKYVFDIVPSKNIHQDTIEVLGGYGGPSWNGNDATLLDSSESGR